MAKSTAEYSDSITTALKAAGRSPKGLEPQIVSLAGALRTLALANDDIDALECTTIKVKTRYGNDTLAPHPAFKVQKDAQSSVTKQMAALGLTVGDLADANDTDPLIKVTKDVRAAGRRKPAIIKPG